MSQPLDKQAHTLYTTTNTNYTRNMTMSRRSRYTSRKRGKISRLEVFPGKKVSNVAWEFGK